MLILLHRLHLDISLGAVAAAFWLGKLFGADIPTSTFALLALAVWLIYTFDHVMDARKFGRMDQSNRYSFYFKYQKWLFIALLLVGALAVVLIFKTDVKILLYGLVPAFLVVLYLLRIHFSKSTMVQSKEVWVAAIYATGIALPTAVAGISALFVWAAFWYFLLVLASLLLYSLMERDDDEVMGLPSLCRTIGSQTLKNYLIGIFSLLFILTLFLSALIGWIWLLPASLMLLAIISMFIWAEKLKGKHRVPGEAMFLLPWLALFF